MSLQDAMSVAADAARKSGKKVDTKKIKARVKAAAAKMNGEIAALAKDGATKLDQVRVAKKPVAVKVTVKQMVLDVFYAGNGTMSTADAVAAIQKAHKGANESSIRVWISDFVKDGTIKVAKKEGLANILTKGSPGKFVGDANVGAVVAIAGKRARKAKAAEPK